ncbi:MAG: hypothetical protein JWQ74_3554 [Marmoricola sp.]|nr:hypothetical protein [Marmoricola sp.]
MSDLISNSAEMSSPAIGSTEPNHESPGEYSEETRSDQTILRMNPKGFVSDRNSFGSNAEEKAKESKKPNATLPSPNSSAQAEPGQNRSATQRPSAGQPILGNEGDQTESSPKSKGAMSGRKLSPKGDHQANTHLHPSEGLPDGTIPEQSGRDEAIGIMNSKAAPLHHELISDIQAPPETQARSDVAGDDGAHFLACSPDAASPVIAEIIQLVKMRRRWQKAETALTLQGKALCRSWTGGDKDEANKLYDHVADGATDDPILAVALGPFLDAKARFTSERLTIEKTLRKLAKSLPVWKEWVEGVKGFGDLRLSIIIGECGDIGGYRNPSCLWKRMGLAVISGERQRRKSDADEAEAHGYNPERRAIAYVMSTELIKSQIRNVKDDDGKRTDQSNAIGPYGQLYLDRKAYEIGREGITKAHANNRAARYMVKRVLRDLFAAWRRTAA